MIVSARAWGPTSDRSFHRRPRLRWIAHAVPVGAIAGASCAAPGAQATRQPRQIVQPPSPASPPLPHGRCAGTYTKEALAAGIEGVVVLDVTVDEHGRPRDITVVQGLSHGLTDPALSALSACTFTPGESNGTPVPVRVRGYKVRFIL
jgi:TonB family protein